MTKQMTERDRRWLPAIIAGLLLIGAAAWASALLPENPPGTATQPTASAQQTLCVWDGKLALFDGADEPIEVYEVAVASLPPEEQERVREGITIESEEMLATLLDNYTS